MKLQELSDEELKALAHPLRMRMLQSLAQDGPATASILARKFDENSGATSYHLRQLARHDFITEDIERKHGRQRWWKVHRRGWSLPDVELQRREETRQLVDVVLRELYRSRIEQLTNWWANQAEAGDDWFRASTDSSGLFHLTVEETARLRDELHDVLMRYAELDDANDPTRVGARSVAVQIYAFPLGDPEDDHVS